MRGVLEEKKKQRSKENEENEENEKKKKKKTEKKKKIRDTENAWKVRAMNYTVIDCVAL